ncbi:expansin-A22-like [Momordica charantia]|uniref:Expansin n=1 Tax=Momordica charantia TaxID=3673 RepID=A0A6J1CTG4_MOMCH|nr:expansin-A22-like [Momordica charantia]
MANPSNNLLLCLPFLAIFVQAMGSRLVPLGYQSIDTTWYDGRATFYGDMSGAETMQGACGYGNLFEQGYGLRTAALSTALFNNGAACGACFEIRCVDAPQSCIPRAGSIKITATNFCPPNYTKTHDIWCNPPQRHFDLSQYMFTRIARYRAGVIPVSYRRIPCWKRCGVKFKLAGNPYWLLVLVFNVGGAGDVADVKIRGSGGEWVQMRRNWGQNWATGERLVGRSLSFRVTTSDSKTIQLDGVVPGDWRFGQTFEGRANF